MSDPTTTTPHGGPPATDLPAAPTPTAEKPEFVRPTDADLKDPDVQAGMAADKAGSIGMADGIMAKEQERMKGPEGDRLIGAVLKAAGQLPNPSKTPATIGRVVLIFDRRFNFGPYPGLVVAVFGGPNINANVLVDGTNERDYLEQVRKSGHGNTLASIPLFDALTPEERTALLAANIGVWAEWMPFQVGQAARTQAAERALEAAVNAPGTIVRDPSRPSGYRKL